jgi:hypothetical protein
MLLRVDAINSVQFSVRSLKLLLLHVKDVQLVLICKWVTSLKRLRAKQTKKQVQNMVTELQLMLGNRTV